MKRITSQNAHKDGLSLFVQHSEYEAGENVLKGPCHVIEDTIIDDVQGIFDGGIDIRGTDVCIRRCVIRNVGKAMLCYEPSSILIEDSIIEDFCRRAPEAKLGANVTLRSCVIRNWRWRRGADRSFGAWAHLGGSIRAESCVFWQDSLLDWRVIPDLTGHIGQMFNDDDMRITNLIPGAMRGLTAGPGGSVSAVHCWRNSPLIRIERHEGPWMPEKEALELIAKLEVLLA